MDEKPPLESSSPNSLRGATLSHRRIGRMRPFRRCPARVVLMLVCPLLVAFPVSAQSTPAELTMPGISIELARHRAATVGNLRYEIALSIPEHRDEPLTGEVTLRFRWDDPGGLPFVVDFQDPGERVLELGVNGGAVATPAFQNNHVVIPPELLQQGEENVVHLRIRAGDGPLNRQEDFFYTLFVPDRAHHALPLLDQPDLKARFALTLDVPGGWEAVANGRRIAEEPVDGGRRRIAFAETEPISTYLLAFAAGGFERVEREVGGHPLVLYHRETDEQRVAGNLDEIFDLHAAALAWLEAYTGITYPFDLFEFVAVPAFQYNGMEHPGAVYYRASSLFLEPSATQAQMLGRASLIAHETAHMWFGDLVTMRWFDDVWTKEVFANFYAAEIVNPAFPELDHDLRFVLSHHPAAYRVDRSRGANPIRQPLENLAEAGSLYGPIIYQKAPIVMRQLERLLGKDSFRAGIREYLERFAFGNASWPELIAILDARTDIDLTSWSTIWVEEAGRPVVEVVRGGEGVVLVQRDPADLGRVWTQTLDPVVAVDGRSRSPGEVRLGGEPVALFGERERPVAGEPDWVLPDGGGYGYARFLLDPASAASLLETVPAIEVPLHRATALLALWDAVLEGELAATAFLDLLIERVENEEEEQLLTRVLGMLETAYWAFVGPTAREPWAARIERTLVTRLARGGPSTRQAALFGALRDVAVTPAALETLREVWAGVRSFPELTLGEADRSATALALALREVEGRDEILDREQARIENPERQERFRFLRPAVDADPAVREAFFASLRLRENRRREPWAQAGLAYLNHPLRADHGLRFVRPSLELLEEIQRTGDIFFPQNWMQSALSGHTSPDAVAVVETFLAERPDYPPRLREKILQALDLTERAARIRGSE